MKFCLNKSEIVFLKVLNFNKNFCLVSLSAMSNKNKACSSNLSFFDYLQIKLKVFLLVSPNIMKSIWCNETMVKKQNYIKPRRTLSDVLLYYILTLKIYTNTQNSTFLNVSSLFFCWLSKDIIAICFGFFFPSILYHKTTTMNDKA